MIDPFEAARNSLSTHSLESWLKCWRDVPPGEDQEMIRAYMNTHLVDRGVIPPTEWDVGDRGLAAVAAGYNRTSVRYMVPPFLRRWIDAWWSFDGVSLGLEDIDSGEKAYWVCHEYREQVAKGVKEDGGWFHYDPRGPNRCEDIRWWCALYARYGARMFWGEGYT